MYSLVSYANIQNYSNPKVKYKNVKTGFTGESENAKQLTSTACSVATFRNTNIQSLNANITGEHFGCPCTNLSLTAQYSGGGPGYCTFEWQTSDDGFNWGSVVGTTSAYTVNLPCTEGALHVRLKVTSPDGQVDFAFQSIEVAEVWDGQEFPCPLQVTGNSSNGNVQTSISPNPASGEIQIEVRGSLPPPIEAQSDNETPTITLLNNVGKVLSIRAIDPLAPTSYTIDVNNLTTGFY